MTYEDIIAAEERRISRGQEKGKGKSKGQVGGTRNGEDTGKGASEQQYESHNQGSSSRVAETTKDTGKQHPDVVVEQRKGEEGIRRLGLQEWCHVFLVSDSHH